MIASHGATIESPSFLFSYIGPGLGVSVACLTVRRPRKGHREAWNRVDGRVFPFAPGDPPAEGNFAMASDDLSDTVPLDVGRGASSRSVTAFFDTRDAADHARDDLVAAGVPSAAVRVAGGQTAMAEPPHPHGFWESLKEFFVPDEDRHMYAEGLRRGGFAVSVETDATAYDRVLEILDRDGAVDMEERSAGWRDEGWGGLTGPTSIGEREMAYTPSGSGTGGFTASRADQPLFDGPMDTAAIEPGSVVPTDPGDRRPAAATSPQAASTPDSAYVAAAPGLGDTARETSPMPGTSQPAPTLSSPMRDTSHGRIRVRSYRGDDPSGDGLPRE